MGRIKIKIPNIVFPSMTKLLLLSQFDHPLLHIKYSYFGDLSLFEALSCLSGRSYVQQWTWGAWPCWTQTYLTTLSLGLQGHWRSQQLLRNAEL